MQQRLISVSLMGGRRSNDTVGTRLLYSLARYSRCQSTVMILIYNQFSRRNGQVNLKMIHDTTEEEVSTNKQKENHWKLNRHEKNQSKVNGKVLLKPN